jgi:hypothetical protein
VSKIIPKFLHEVIHHVFVSIRIHNLQILRIERGSTPGSIEAFWLRFSLIAIANVKRCTLSFSRSFPHRDQILDRWTSSSVSRPYDAVMPLRHPRPQPYSWRRDLTGWPLSSSVLSTPDTGWLNDRYSPAAAIKGKPFTRNRWCESSISVRARYHHRSCFASG